VNTHDDEGFTGRGRVFEDAIEEAYQKAQGVGNGPGWYKVVGVSVRIENPVKEYLVTIVPGE
jgi:hypothetical protein